jgi:hypothetical protein
MDKPSFDFAADVCKQILTFSTSILALTVTFAKDTFLKDRQTVPWPLLVSWLFYLVSIFGGICTLCALTGELTKQAEVQPSIWQANVRTPAIILVVSFFVGLIFTVLAGWHAVSPPSVPSDSTKTKLRLGELPPPQELPNI